jgi:hypothetical protein
MHKCAAAVFVLVFLLSAALAAPAPQKPPATPESLSGPSKEIPPQPAPKAPRRGGGGQQPGSTPQGPGATIDPSIARAKPCDFIPFEGPGQRNLRPLSNVFFFCLPWRDIVSWITVDNRREHYYEWPQSRRDRLDEFWRRIQANEDDLGVACPAAPVTSGTLTHQQAEDIYLVHVAHALFLEWERRLPWRLWQLNDAERRMLLAPEHFVIANRTPDGAFSNYSLPASEASWLAFDCDPRVGYRFMTGDWPGQTRNLLGASEIETLMNLSAWFRREMGHGAMIRADLEANAHLAKRLTRYLEPGGPLVMYWAPMGCHSAAQTFADIARAVNIPVLRARSGDLPNDNRNHAALVFRWTRTDARVLQHVDDIYAVDWVAFPIDAAGRALSGAEADRAFFDAHWRSPADLRAHGFDYSLQRLPLFYERPGGAAQNDHPGWSIGLWSRTPADRPDRAPASAYRFRLAKAYDIGGYGEVNKLCRFAQNTPDPAAYWQAHIDARGGTAPPANITGAMLHARLQAIAAAHGGCDEVVRMIDEAEAYKRRPL